MKRYVLPLLTLVAAILAISAATPQGTQAACAAGAPVPACGGGSGCSFDLNLYPGQGAYVCTWGISWGSMTYHTTMYGSGCETLIGFSPYGPLDRRCSSVSSMTVYPYLGGNTPYLLNHTGPGGPVVHVWGSVNY